MADVGRSTSGSPLTGYAPRAPLLLSVFGAVALLLAGLGIYGVVAYGVTGACASSPSASPRRQRDDHRHMVLSQGIALPCRASRSRLAGAAALAFPQTSCSASAPATFRLRGGGLDAAGGVRGVLHPCARLGAVAR
jgi:hypothetical protein